jgi:hypothetical protein
MILDGFKSERKVLVPCYRKMKSTYAEASWREIPDKFQL